MVEWPLENKRVMRSGSSWNDISAVLEDKTKSGKTKRRLYASMGKRTFTVTMHFTKAEYDLFEDWYAHVCYYGLNSFGFPQVDAVNGGEREYRFAAGAAPAFSNVGGEIIECAMNWEEV